MLAHGRETVEKLRVTLTDLSSIFFFFQAEDGIRDYKVTGVQTCALPISARSVFHASLLPFVRWAFLEVRDGSSPSRPMVLGPDWQALAAPREHKFLWFEIGRASCRERV